MKITGHEFIDLEGPTSLLRVFTDGDITGIGEPLDYGHGAVVQAATDQMFEYLRGRDPRLIEDHWQQLYRESYSRNMPILIGALSGIEQALWDILGKSLGVPVRTLFGGSVRDRIRVYAAIDGQTSSELRDDALRATALGYSAVKMTPVDIARPIESRSYIQDALDRVDAVRSAVGSEIDIAIDLHRRLTSLNSIRLLQELEAFSPLFVEEPCQPENVLILQRVARSTSIPIAVGERYTTRWAFREILELGAAGVIQPDVRHVGGMLEMRKIASLAEVHDIYIAPHSAAGPVGIVASLQVNSVVPNFLIQEFGAGSDMDILDPHIARVGGDLLLPDNPGLGVELDMSKVDLRRAATPYRRQMRRHLDGSVADH